MTVASFVRLTTNQRNENDGLIAGRASHTDRRGHRSRARIDPLPHAGRRPEITPARHHLALAFLETILRECRHDVLRGCDPSVLLGDPRHPAPLAKLIEAIDRIVFSRSQRRNRAGTTMCPEGVRAGAGRDSGREPPPWLTCPRRSTR